MITFSILHNGDSGWKWFLFEDIQPGAGNATGAQGLDHCFFIDCSAAANIDYIRTIFHPFKSTRIEHMMALCGQRHS